MPTADLPSAFAEALRALHAAGKVTSPWLPGMGVLCVRRTHCGVSPGTRGHLLKLVRRRVWSVGWEDERCSPAQVACLAPDPDSHATMGCLLALVREAFGDNTIHPSPATYDRYDDGEPEIRWHVNRHHEGEDEWMRESGAFGELNDGHRDPPIVGPTEAHALLAALRAALPTEPT